MLGNILICLVAIPVLWNATPAEPVAHESKPLTLSFNFERGKLLELSDGSVFEVAPDDRLFSVYWVTPFDVHIEPSSDLPEYPYLLTNMQSGTSVHVRKLSNQEVQDLIRDRVTPPTSKEAPKP